MVLDRRECAKEESGFRFETDGETRSSAGDRRFYFLAVAALLVYLAILYWPPTGEFFSR